MLCLSPLSKPKNKLNKKIDKPINSNKVKIIEKYTIVTPQTENFIFPFQLTNLNDLMMIS